MDRKGLPKRTIEQGLLVTANDGRDQSRKGGSVPGQVQGEGKSPTSSDAKSLKAACPGKQNPLSLWLPEFLLRLSPQVWALGTYFKVSLAQISSLLLLSGLYS